MRSDLSVVDLPEASGEPRSAALAKRASVVALMPQSDATLIAVLKRDVEELKADIAELRADAREREKRESRVVWGFVLLLGGAVTTLAGIIWNYVRAKTGL